MNHRKNLTPERVEARPGVVKPQVYAGLFLVTSSTLMYEILLPRIFSVTMFYHFAFMAVSVAMFGMTVGAVLVYVRPDRYTEAHALDDLATHALAFSLTLVASFALYLRIPPTDSVDATGILRMAATYSLISVPFVFSGITVAVALTRFPRHVAPLYAADLGGAAVGCLIILGTLSLTDALTAAVVIATVAAGGAACFAWGTARSRLRLFTIGSVVVLGLGAAGHHVAAASGRPLLRLEHRIFPNSPRDYERWNAFSYVEVFPSATVGAATGGWGMSRTLPKALRIVQRGVSIDEKAGTSMTEYHGDRKGLEFLRYDVTNAAHVIRKNADVCVIGVGGGKDIISALYFDQRSVFAIELNENMLRPLLGQFGEFSGHLDRDPRITLVSDEARSYLARTNKRCDILQISLIDTFAATAAGAFVLAENSLYTAEAWDLFLRRLTPNGVLSVSRYYFNRRPAEAYRMLGLAVAALERNGIHDPRRHLLLVKSQPINEGFGALAGDASIGTLLVSRSPFSASDIERMSDYARTLQFDTVLSPDHALDPVLETIANGRGLDAFYAGYDIDISPPVDDRPFFFQMLRPRDVLRTAIWKTDDVNWKNMKAVLVLMVLLGVVVTLTVACVVVPLWMTARGSSIRTHASSLVYFAAIGFAFMFIEMAQMQRFMIFLGHPTYALSVVLFTLLLASGVGSMAAGGVSERFGPRALPGLFLVLTLLLVGTGLVTPLALRHFAGVSTAARIALAVALLTPAGFAMGMPFPLGIRHASRHSSELLPWLWGVNGAASVCCSVLAIMLALSNGIGVTFWAGVLSYVVAAAAYGLPSSTKNVA